MKPPRFQYCAPDMLDEALALLDQCGGEAKVLAGGQSLIPLLNMRLAGPAYIVDINQIHLQWAKRIQRMGTLLPPHGKVMRLKVGQVQIKPLRQLIQQVSL